MAYRTFADLRSQILVETDTEGEDFIQPTELVGFLNSAVTVAESEIIKLGLREKYLQGEAYISTVTNQADYDLPSDMVDTQIRKIIYRNGSIKYEIKPLLDEDQYLKEDIYNDYSANESYWYQLYKDQSSDALKLRLTPKASNTVANALRVIYWRSLNRMIDENDTTTNCDVPWVVYEFILSYVRRKIYKKELNMSTEMEQGELDSMLALTRETLQQQIADPNVNMIDMDVTIYGEMS
jgi:hypothetical protein